MNTNEIDEFLENRNYKRVKNRRNRIKEELVKYKGGKCEICGYDKCINALEFHHLDPNEKDFTIGQYSTLSFDKIKNEVDKCILVCSNCHREIHYNEHLATRKKCEQEEKNVYTELIKNREKYGVVRIKDSYKYLNECGIIDDINNNVSRKDILEKYHINNRMFNKFLEYNGIEYNHRKMLKDKPNKEELLELLKTNTKSSVGRMFGVTCGAVRKWCKKYNIS